MFSEFPIHLKKSRNVGSAITVSVDVRVSNTGKITGQAELRNFQALFGGQAQWNFVLLDAGGNCLWVSRDEWHTVGPCSVFNRDGERASLAIDQVFPIELVDRVADVDVILTRRDKTLGQVLGEVMKALKDNVKSLSEVEDALDRLMRN